MNLFELVAKILLDDSGFKDGVKTDGKLLENVGKKIKGGLATAAKVGTAALGAASAGVAALAKQSLDQYAQYEQLVGGVETLFKGSADTVVNYANNAYKTAGMSANDYMDTVTSFSASLLQSLGGDTDKAAKYADIAITDMSDNANKMGTSIESIVNTYQSLSRGNFAMLDNLKLGYGGTKKELERLVSDANEVKKANGEMADLSIDNFSNVVEAIHIMQTEMDISGISAEEAAKAVASGAMTQEEAFAAMGTTAKEAATTIEGSMNSAKAAWQNLLTGLGNESADLDQLVNNFVTSAEAVASNVLPRIQQILGGMNTAISKLAPILGEEIPKMIAQVLPGMVDGGAKLLLGIIQGISSMLSELPKSADNIITTLANGLTSAIPQLISSAGELIMQLANALMSYAPQLLQQGTEMALEIINGLATGMSQNISNFAETALPMLVQFSERLRSNAGKLVDAGLNLIMQLADGIINSIPTLIQTVPTIVTNIASIINDNAPKLLKTAVVLIGKLAIGLIKAIPTLVKNIPKIIQAIVAVFTAFNWINVGKNIITSFAKGIKNMVGQAKSAAGNVKTGIVNAIKELPKTLLNLGKNAITSLRNGISGMLGAVKGAAGKILTAIVSAIKALPGKLLSIGKSAVKNVFKAFSGGGWRNIGTNIIKGIIGGLTGALPKLYGKIKSGLSGLVAKAEKALGINSPSKVFRDRIGKSIIEGLVLGIERGESDVEDAMDDVYDSLYDYPGDGALNEIEAVPVVGGSGFGYGGNEITININIDGAKYQDEDTLADIISRKLQLAIEREAAVFGA